MKESIESLLDQLRVICNNDGQETINNALSELRSLRAEAEAWRAVREAWESKETRGEAAKYAGYEIRDQIARLDAMKEGESNGNS